MGYKEQYRRFRQWQLHPIDYQEDTETHHCINCEREFRGNFCPTCGQNAKTGAVTWTSIRLGVMDVWGMGGRSLPYTIVQLLFRPGNLIGDYLDGRRQLSFPPVKMLVLVALVAYLFGEVLFPDAIDSSSQEESVTIIDRFIDWVDDHYDYGPLICFLCLSIPSFIIFQYSPRHNRHTIPQEFFIQVFNSIQLLILMIPYVVLDDFWALAFLPFLMVLFWQILVTYKQLFGYNWWGTVWRLLTCLLLCSLFIIIIIYGVNVIVFHAPTETSLTNVYWQTGSLALGFLLISCIVTIINRRGEARRKH